MVELRHLHTVRRKLADGSYRTHYYHRRTKKRIEGEFGSPEFLVSYAQAEKISREPDEGRSLGNLLHRYRQSVEYAQLSNATRRNYEPILATLRSRWSQLPLSIASDDSFKKGIRDLRDEVAKRSLRQADYYVQVLSAVLSFGIEDGAITHNPARGLGKLYKANRADKIWLPEDVKAFESVASPELMLGLQLGLQTGQREKDLIELPWSAFNKIGITLRQSKTGRDVYVPCTEDLLEVLDRTPRRSTLIMTNTRGNPWTQDGFKTSWRKAAIQAGVHGRLTFNDLRGTTVTMLSEAGCTVPEIATITGHTLKSVDQILERYMSRTKNMATSAIIKLDEWRRTKKQQTL